MCIYLYLYVYAIKSPMLEWGGSPIHWHGHHLKLQTPTDDYNCYAMNTHWITFAMTYIGSVRWASNAATTMLISRLVWKLYNNWQWTRPIHLHLSTNTVSWDKHLIWHVGLQFPWSLRSGILGFGSSFGCQKVMACALALLYYDKRVTKEKADKNLV